MQQLSLEQLEVESYTVQPSEQELTDLKGGTGWKCLFVGQAIDWIERQFEGGDDKSEGTTVKAYGITVDSLNHNGTTVYDVYLDSLSISY